MADAWGPDVRQIPTRISSIPLAKQPSSKQFSSERKEDGEGRKKERDERKKMRERKKERERRGRERGREKSSMGHVVRRARDNQCSDVTDCPTNRKIAPFKPGSLGLRVESRRDPSDFSPTAVRPRSLRRANSRIDPLSRILYSRFSLDRFRHRK